MKNLSTYIFTLILLAIFPGSDIQSMGNPAIESKGDVKKAKCVVNPTQGSQVMGTVTFTKVEHGVKIVADIEGLTPGKHGIHIHEFGDCSSPDGNSAGGHFNPSAKGHGAPADANRHAGDMGNIEADANGKGHLEYVDHSVSLGGDHSIIGKSMIVHANEDDLKTQPTGNAGARLGCGVIEASK